MTDRSTRLAALTLSICLTLPALAAPARDVPVTSIVSDYAADIAPALQIQSDQLGSYRNSKTLTSLIQSVGAWLLDTTGSTRSVYLGFTQPIPGSGLGGGDPVVLPSGHYNARLILKCNAVDQSMLTLPAGATITCPLHIAFSYNGNDYAIQMNPGASPNGTFPETNYANVSCIFPTGGANPCSQWKLTPSASSTMPDDTVRWRNVAKLLKYSTSRGTTVANDQGDFYFSFLILVSNP